MSVKEGMTPLIREYFTLQQQSWEQIFGQGSRNRETDERLEELEIQICKQLGIKCFWDYPMPGGRKKK